MALLVTPMVMLMAASAAERTKVPGYPHGKFQGDCALCHGANSWSPAQISRKFDHAKFGFSLVGAHAAADCQTCHESLEFSVQKTQCISCHEDTHLGELGQDCARCHTARSFIDRSGMIRGHQATRFALTGSHTVVECESCHRPAALGHMQFVNTRAECGACHMEDYDGTASPNHATSGFSTECALCHSTMTWQGGHFSHANITAVCNTCHMPDYDATTDPPHAGSGFPTDCASCHNTRSWLGATFDHDRFFPIYSGKHRDKWNSCSDCHTSPGNNSIFSCLTCHPHSDQRKTDEQHSGRNGYVYESLACLNCHPRGTN